MVQPGEGRGASLYCPYPVNFRECREHLGTLLHPARSCSEKFAGCSRGFGASGARNFPAEKEARRSGSRGGRERVCVRRGGCGGWKFLAEFTGPARVGGSRRVAAER